PRSSPLPYTTLFRSRGRRGGAGITVVRELRRPPDAPRVKQTLARVAVVHRVAIHVEPKDPGTLDEERAPFLEERLERAEVEDCRDRKSTRLNSSHVS